MEEKNCLEAKLVNREKKLTPVWHDRDEFISINRENIDPRMNISFKKTPYEVEWADTQHTPYDFNSVTKFEERADLGTQTIWAICSTSSEVAFCVTCN